jgi:hypothetical protein
MVLRAESNRQWLGHLGLLDGMTAGDVYRNNSWQLGEGCGWLSHVTMLISPSFGCAICG